MKKEEIDHQKVEDKIVVVFDVLLATSTIVSALHFGAKAVIPVLNEQHARELVKQKHMNNYLLAGESEGRIIDGFLDPNPLVLQREIKDQTMVLATTNGTVAIHSCQHAKKVYIASLLNGNAIANELISQHRDESIVIVCSGSSGQFCIEDMLGAGYLIHMLEVSSSISLELSDSALAALYLYRNSKGQLSDMLHQSRVGKMLYEQGYGEALEFIKQESLIPLVASLSPDGEIKVNNNELQKL